MKRLHLFEFNDLAWFPNVWRNLMTDYLHFVEVKFEMFKFVAPKVKEVLEKCRSAEIADLCSGATGPVIETQKWLLKEFDQQVQVTVTDLYPSLEKFRATAEENKNVEFISTPIDATKVPGNLKGVRTLFNAFHHFQPETARKILENAVQEQKGIAVFEATQRTFLGIFSMFLTPLIVWLTTPFIRPLTLPRILWTYLIPVIPLTVLWDGTVSALRTYSTRELKEMSASIPAENYAWETGQITVKGSAKITYLIGYPAI
jgi:hypothetical protein